MNNTTQIVIRRIFIVALLLLEAKCPPATAEAQSATANTPDGFSASPAESPSPAASIDPASPTLVPAVSPSPAEIRSVTISAPDLQVLVSREVQPEVAPELPESAEPPQEATAEPSQPIVESIASAEGGKKTEVGKKIKKMEGTKETKEKAKMQSKTLSGEISASNHQGVAVIYERNEKKGYENEFWLPFSEDLELKGYKKIRDLRPGDRVEVRYEETEMGSNRTVKKIVLREKAPKPQEVEDEPEQ